MAVELIKAAWMEVTVNCIRNCFFKAAFLWEAGESRTPELACGFMAAGCWSAVACCWRRFGMTVYTDDEADVVRGWGHRLRGARLCQQWIKWRKWEDHRTDTTTTCKLINHGLVHRVAETARLQESFWWWALLCFEQSGSCNYRFGMEETK